MPFFNILSDKNQYCACEDSEDEYGEGETEDIPTSKMHFETIKLLPKTQVTLGTSI